MRQSTLVRTKEANSEGELKNSSIVNTNMLHLYRYAKHLGCQQRLEITKEDKRMVANENMDVNTVSGDGAGEGCVKEDVHVKDYLPALKAICDKLDQAGDKILLVEDIKRDLGYRTPTGHRAWRNICNRLKDARIVEEFCAKLNEKEVSCLRLLKSFSPKDDVDTEQQVKFGKRGQITEQLLELPIEHQIYGIVAAEGSKGLTITEICKRLGINNKRYYRRLLTMFLRFGMPLEAENLNRGLAYRVWTSENFNLEASNKFVSKPENVSNENGTYNPPDGNLARHEKSAQAIPELDLWTSNVNIEYDGKAHEEVIEPELSHASPSNELQVVSAVAVSNVATVETSSLDLSTPRRRRSYEKYPCLTSTASSVRREQWILLRLQEEKFIIRAELTRELESLEKDKLTKMDRKTVNRTLIKLQEEGHCKCIRVSVPVVTNCSRSRTTDVVLQPSLEVSPELLGKIHEKLRSFDMEIRAQCSSRSKKGQSVPVIDGVQRIFKSAKSDDQAERSEAMRANGFVLAKMVRTKLLHIYLWGYVSGSPGWDDALSFGKPGYDLKNPHSTCKIFALDATIKAMPVELFLQVVGSTRKFEDMVEKCRSGLRLSDLPDKEYKSLMDTLATGRLSCIIDRLRRLKLIRLERDGHSEEITNIPHATLTHALELKPYIEEPVSIVMASSGVFSFDLRPQVRHDFILSSRKAVDEYWNTLEFSYAAADSKAALHAFPGSAVPEVFLWRTWASVRVMTADQRAELLKRVVNDDLNKKLPFKECEKIAEDLNLTLEQVLRVYYDKRQKRLARFQGGSDARGEEFQPQKKRHVSSSRKRKNTSEGRSSRRKKIGIIDKKTSGQGLGRETDTEDQFLDGQNAPIASSGEDSHLHTFQDGDRMEAIEEVESKEEVEHHSFIHECAFSSIKSTRQRKFSWTEKAERQLVIEYVRYRAALGANFHCTDWSSLRDLPAPPAACKRRMALLNSDLKFRKAVLRLCNMLGERYAKHLDKLQNKSLSHGDCRGIVEDSLFGKNLHRSLSCNDEHSEDMYFEGRWDDFDDVCIKVALDEVLHYKRIAKRDASKRARSVPVEWSELNMDAGGHDHLGSGPVSEDIRKHGGGNNVCPRRSRRRRLPQKYSKLLHEGSSVSRWAHESVAVSNAAELFKLVFLSTSTAPEVPNLLAETLRRYSEHDLFAAFNYLREKKIMVGGSGGNPFILSQQFLQSISSSPFPTNTGNRSAKFASWLQEKEKELMEDGIDITAELQCGDVFHLCALVSSGEWLISPCLPDEGVGEAEDLRILKQKFDSSEFRSGERAKKLKSSLAGEGEIISCGEGELIPRRGKGFPGILLTISRAIISTSDTMDLFKDGNNHSGMLFSGENDQVIQSSSVNIGATAFPSDHIKEILYEGSSIPTAVAAGESEWETMTIYAARLMALPTDQQKTCSFYPELFRNVYSAIQKAGDQGLSMEEVSQVINMEGENIQELIVEVLEAFGRALKVNAYDSVHIVDSLYRSKYFLTSMANCNQDLEVSLPAYTKIDNGQVNPPTENLEDHGANVPKDLSMDSDEVHKVTILNLPEEVYHPSSEMRGSKKSGGWKQAKVIAQGNGHEGETFGFCSDDFDLCAPILPWVNGDGTINTVVHKGLVRRVLGIVMQNPGILEEGIINRMSVLNPQSCRSLLKLMIMDNHIIVRKMHETTYGEAPSILASLLGSRLKKSKMISREHYFANPLCTTLL